MEQLAEMKEVKDILDSENTQYISLDNSIIIKQKNINDKEVINIRNYFIDGTCISTYCYFEEFKEKIEALING
ncbi:hypothetical protein [Clostridium gasigenes]|uniref:Uncharacterized protein n=1 Tax=Clostridium gasigenes TaxID=94869 RepID=A0A1H0N2U0_9CLOT|nr:hypothetical protein [Clostridium gasigenes]SDO86931.1 hypothetical protein SAMN04488529_101663 [Clostridium gasigenes]